MAWHKKLIKAIETFIEHAYRKKSWYVWTAFIGACFMFWINYQLSNPDEQAQLKKAVSESEVKVKDDEILCSLSEQITNEGEATTRVLNQFLSIVQDIRDSGRIDNRQQQIEENYNLAIETKKQTELLLARVKGTYLRVPVYNEQVRMYETILAGELKLLTMIEDFSAAYLAGDAKRFAQEVQQIVSQYSTLLKELETGLAQQKSLNLQRASTLKSVSIENERAMERAWIHRIRGYLQFPILGLFILYFITIGMGVKNSWKKSHEAAMRQKLAVDKPSNRRKKR